MKEKIRVASFNLQNLQLPDKTVYYGNPPYSVENMSQEEAYIYKANWISSKLIRMQADIIAFQEIWDPLALSGALTQDGLDTVYKTITNSDVDNGISVGLAYRHEMFAVREESIRWIKEMPPELVLKKYGGANDPRDYQMSLNIKNFSRAVLKVTLLHKKLQEEITIYVAHFKSKIPMGFSRREYKQLAMGDYVQRNGKALSSIRRIAEASGLRILLDKQMKGTHDAVIVMGDLNDDEISDTIDIVTDTPSYRLSVNSQQGRMSDKGLYSAAALNDFSSRKDVLYSYIHGGKKSMLDHILFSEQFYDESKNRKWTFEKFRMINDYLDDDHPLESDHGIPVVTFQYNPANR